MRNILCFLAGIVLFLLAGCGGGSAFEKELAANAWIESAQGNEFEYLFTKDTFTYKIGDQSISIPIVSIDDQKRILILKPEQRNQYLPVWWSKPAGGTVKITSMVDAPAYASLEEALAGPKPDKEYELKAK